MVLTDTIKVALIAQVACGDKGLKELLEAEIDLLYMCQGEIACTDRLRYLYTQLGLIEIAQIYSRNKIDTHTRTAVGQAHETFSALQRRNMDAESTATGRACSWAAAASQQYFTRTSTDDTVAFSESNLLRTALRTEDGFDRSRRSTNGSGFSRSLVTHIVEDRGGNALREGAGRETRNTVRVSQTVGGTSALVPLQNVHWDFSISYQENPPAIVVGGASGLVEIPKPTQICPDPDPEFPGNVLLCTEAFVPSMGQGYHGKYRFSITAPTFGALTLEWDDAFNERQYYHCTGATVDGSTIIVGRQDALNSATTTALPQDNATGSSESSTTVHYVRKTGTSTRRGTDTIDAEERQRGYADGLAHSDSTRDAKGQASQERRSESLTTAHSESHLRKNETVNDEEIRRSYGQISTALGQLWKRIWAHIQLLEREIAAVPRAGQMVCPCNRVGCKGCMDVSYLPGSYRRLSRYFQI